MHKMLIAMSLLVSACAPSTNPAPTAPARGHMASTDANPKRVTHPEPDMTCQDETPTGTQIDRRKCRSNVEREQDRQFARDQILDPASRPSCDPTQGLCNKDPGVTPYPHH